MSFFDKILTKFFGNKSERDINEVKPILEKIKAIYPEIESLTNDQLREKSQNLKQTVRD